MHAALLWKYIRDDENILKAFFQSKNPRALFVDSFIQQLKDDTNTAGILTAECEKGHKFETRVRTIAFCMFNMFAKNYVQERNDELHAQRRRSKVEKAAKKRDKCSMKESKANG